jgi:ABC-type multidrug transport system fused ATPase/permease subunit
MKIKPSVANKQGARPLKFKRGDVHLDQVCFSYDKRRSILNGISLHVPAGTTVAFVGSTGAGKSTLLRLLQRDYDVTSGSIRIDGQDLRDVDSSR